jgi:plastocyanin|tara:strand:- start:21171 stop:21407 length:237 start_codon:yes stop_codon:yes gene_type:complete
MASGYLRLMLDSARRCAAATQDAAEDARKAAQEAQHEAQEIDQMAQDAASKAVEAGERVKVLEAKVLKHDNMNQEASA